MKILFTVIGIIALLFLIFMFIGIIAPRIHKGSVSHYFESKPAEIWAILINIETLPDRRREIKAVEMLDTNEKGMLQWKELTDMGGFAVFEITEQVEHEVLEIRMNKSSFGITGTWRYEITKENDLTKVTITESSSADNLWVRSMLAIAGRNATLKQELRNLENALKMNQQIQGH